MKGFTAATGSPTTLGRALATAPTWTAGAYDDETFWGSGRRFCCRQRFELLRELGAGGMGVVYLAHDHRDARRVAVKILTSFEYDHLYRFKREFRALADVRHPNLLVLHELIQCDGQFHLVMEFVDGVDLGKRLLGHPMTEVESGDRLTLPLGAASAEGAGRTGPCVDDVALRACFAQLAFALQGLHEAGWLHRDLKPTNVIVDRVGHLTLLDFGMVADRWALPTRLTLDDRAFGTPAYMAPEQAAGDPATPASDWYAFGVMLYEMLTGCLPFEGSMLEILSGKQRRLPRPPRALCASAPEDLNAVCMELLQRHPCKRPAADEVLERFGVKQSQPAQPARGRAWLGGMTELETLRAAFDEVRDGRAASVRIEGPSGTGKSALGERFLETVCEPEDVVVLTARLFEHESLPMKGIDMLVESLGRYLKGQPAGVLKDMGSDDVQALAAVFPVLRKVPAIERAHRAMSSSRVVGPAEAGRRARIALVTLLRRVAAERPLVLWMDDAQHCDPASAQLLARLVRGGERPVLLVTASRPRQGDALTCALGQFGNRRRIVLKSVS